MRRIIKRYQDGGAVEFGPYMPDQSPSDFQPGAQQQGTGSNAGSDGYNMQEFVDNNNPVNNNGANVYPSVGPLGVNPMVSTGIPQGGHAKQAIADYLAGKSLGDPLSYVAGQSNVPDYRALADALGPRYGSSQPDAVAGVAVEDGNTEHSDMMRGNSNTSVANNTTSTGSDGTTGSWVSDQEIYGAPGGHWGGANGGIKVNIPQNVTADNPSGETYVSPHAAAQYETNLINNPHIGDEEFWDTFESGEASGGVFSGGGRDGAGNWGVAGDVGAAIYDAAGNLLNGSLIGRGYNAITGKNLLNPYDATQYPDGVIPNEYNPDGTPKTTGLNLTGPVDPNLILHSGGGYNTSAEHGTANDSIQGDINSAAMHGGRTWSPALGRYLNANQHANRLRNGLPRNNGGPIGPLAQRYNNGSPGGVTTAKSGIREEEIRERQRMQARLPKVKASPVSGIGERLAMGAVNNGINTGLATMAGKEGLMGTLGTMMGSGGGAAAGTGMMSALGPIGIGFGLGKMFGLFNDGGKVPCSCGKTPCKCAKRKKSPLSGE